MPALSIYLLIAYIIGAAAVFNFLAHKLEARRTDPWLACVAFLWPVYGALAIPVGAVVAIALLLSAAMRLTADLMLWCCEVVQSAWSPTL